MLFQNKWSRVYPELFTSLETPAVEFTPGNQSAVEEIQSDVLQMSMRASAPLHRHLHHCFNHRNASWESIIVQDWRLGIHL